MTDALICCPDCHRSLEIPTGEGVYTCPGCQRVYQARQGVIDFTPDNRFYWGEVSQERMEQVNRRAEREGWFQAFLEDIQGANQRDMVSYLLDPVRIAGLFHYYDPKQRGVCVDLGSGWGPISFGLSKFYDQVYSMDGVFERMRFQAIRAEQEGVKNIRLLRGSLLKLPLLDNLADTVIVNGLLEWIGLSDEVTPPRELQLAFLREVRRVLKPGGRLFIGIENRYGAHFFLGSRDHSGLRYTSLMPRWMADRAVQRSRRMADASFFEGAKNSYRTLVYTRWGYQKLLRQAGFNRPDFYWAWPSYNEPRVSGTLDGSSVAFYLQTLDPKSGSGIRRAVTALARRLPKVALGWLIQLFAPHFLMVTGKGRPEPGLEAKALGANARHKLLRMTLHTERNLTTSFVALNGHGARKIATFSEKPVGAGSTGFQLDSVEGSLGALMRPAHAGDVRAAGDWLAAFQRKTDGGLASFAARQEEMWRLVEQTRWFTGELAPKIEDYAQYYLSKLQAHGSRLVREHGEFVPRNIFINRDRPARVAGWNHARDDGNPVMDAGAMTLALLLRQSGMLPVFERSYNRWGKIPLRIAPVYYILRVIERDFDPAAGPARNYLGQKVWQSRLRMALAFAQDEEREKVLA